MIHMKRNTFRPALAAAAFLSVASLVIWVTGCGGEGQRMEKGLGSSRLQPTPQAVAQATRNLTEGRAPQVTNAVGGAGFRLFQEVVEANPNRNVFLSPASVTLALAMTYNGAAGETRASMAKALGIDGLDLAQANAAYRDLQTVLRSPDKGVTLDIQNAVWAHRETTFQRDFLARNEQFFGATARTVDFKNQAEAAQIINDWVKQATRERIPKLADQFDADARMVLANAVYFLGLWKEPFQPDATVESDFTKFDGKTQKVPLMTREGDFLYQQGNNFQAVRIPYGETGRTHMTVFLPRPGLAMGEFLKTVNARNWSEWSRAFRMRPGTVQIPRFRAEFSTILNEPLKAMGMGPAFDPNRADFSGMTGQRDLFIGQVIHKTFVEVKEEGTEAAAVTGVEMRATAAPMEPEERFRFRADRPFVYAIEDSQTGVILFLGVFGDPGA
ncbi:MAG: serpin family protein [Fimbriimonadaceae bacterium]